MNVAKRTPVDEHARNRAQGSVYYHVSHLQTRHKGDEIYDTEMPHQLVIGEVVGQATRAKGHQCS